MRFGNFAARRVLFVFSLAGAVGGVSQQAMAQAQPLAASAALVTEHALAQQGLSIGLLVSSILTRSALIDASALIGRCDPALSGAGSIKTLSVTNPGKANAKATVEIYFDNVCKKRFLRAQMVATANTITKFTIKETTTMYDLAGANKGVLTVTTNGAASAGSLLLSATGTFKPTASDTAHVGYRCTLPAIQSPARAAGQSAFLAMPGPISQAASVSVPCQVGIAQQSPVLGIDIASLTSVTAKVTQVGTVTFAFSNAQLVRGAAGKLGISAPTVNNLAITGATTSLGSASGNGSLATFAIFQQGPTKWTSTAQTRIFSIAMLGGKTAANGTIKSGTTPLASFTLDTSGTGSITYSDKKKTAITGWVLAN